MRCVDDMEDGDIYVACTLEIERDLTPCEIASCRVFVLMLRE